MSPRASLCIVLATALLSGCGRGRLTAPTRTVKDGGAVPSAVSAITVSRAELNSGALRVEGSGAAPNATVTIDGGAASGSSDGVGAFRIQKSPFSSPTCRITVSDGTSSAQATLSGCAATAPPPATGPPAPALLTPAGGSSVVQPIALSWAAVTDPNGILGYNWQVSATSTFASVIAWGTRWFTAQGVPPPAQDRLSGLANGSCFWRVQAVNGASPPVFGAWSATGSFTIAGSSATTPGIPAIATPANAAQFHPFETFTLSWAPVPGAARYVFEYDDEPSFSYPLANGFGTDLAATSVGQLFGFARTFYYRVRGVSADSVRGLPSPAVQVVLTYTAPIPPPPTLLAPTGGTQTSLPIAFDWTSVANEQVQGYELQIDRTSAFTGDCGTVELCVRGITGSQYTLTSLTGGSKFWRVRSYHGESAPGVAAVTAWSATQSFTVPVTPPSLLAFTINVYGGGGTVLRSHTNAYSGTTADNLAFANVQLSGPAPAGGTVVAFASSNPAVAVVPASVTIAAGEAIGGFRIEPQQVLVSSPVTLSATLGTTTVTAPFTVDPPNLKRLEIGVSPVPPVFSSGTIAPGSITLNGQAPAAGAVVALSSSNPAVASVPASVTVPAGLVGISFPVTTSVVSVTTTATVTATWKGQSVQSPITLLPAPTLVSPATGAAFATGQTVTFDWNDLVLGSSQYEIQINNSNLFAAPVLVDQTTSTISQYTTATLPGGSLLWRVRAFDVFGDPGPWSEVRSVTVTAPVGPLPAPTLMFPTADARVAVGQPVAFMWSSVAGANSYTLQVDDASSFTAPFILNQNVVGSNQFNTSTLPTLTMWWRVRANDAAGNPGTWSVTRRFEVK